MDTSRILTFGCHHIPYHHIDSISFLKEVKKAVQPTLYIHMGDEIDAHGMSYHESDPDLDAPGPEYRKALNYISEVYDITDGVKTFVMESNHGSMVYRRAKTAGIPKEMLKPYKEIWKAPSSWTWRPDLTLELPDGQQCHFAHQLGMNSLLSSQSKGMNVVQAHNHHKFDIQFWSASDHVLNFGAHCGSLVDQDSLAMAYGKVYRYKCALGCMAIVDSKPIPFPMKLDKRGRWIGRL